jgi:hypothetical protein
MAGKKQQTHAKRARELAVKERRERKRAKLSETAEERAASREFAAGGDNGDQADEAPVEKDAGEWVQ